VDKLYGMNCKINWTIKTLKSKEDIFMMQPLLNQIWEFSIKSGQVHHGYKLSVKLDVDHELIREFETVTASQHGATIEQIKEGDIADRLTVRNERGLDLREMAKRLFEIRNP